MSSKNLRHGNRRYCTRATAVSLKRAVRTLEGVLCFGLPLSLFACGPYFPNFLLAQGDAAVLVAPQGDFAAELGRMNFMRSRVQAVPLRLRSGAGDYAGQSADAELGDLEQALAKRKISAEDASRIVQEHRLERQKLTRFVEARQFWTWFGPAESTVPANLDAETQARKPEFGHVRVVEGLPAEFADYFEGFIAWHNLAIPDKAIARVAWERLLARPAGERRFKSVWSAFMLGKSWEHDDPERAVGYFKQVRQLARVGFKDTVGLAAASLGLEARILLHQKDFALAVDLYLEQLASGDLTAADSLRICALQALCSGSATLETLAHNPRTRMVVTAYVISRREDTTSNEEKGSEPLESGSQGHAANLGIRWLTAVESAGISDVASAEALALAAYRLNRMDVAQRWIKRAPNAPVAQWLQAKLLLRAGKVDSAAALLARLSPLFPIVHEGTNAPAPEGLKDTLRISEGEGSYNQLSAERQLRGELGVLRLARGEYTQALDALLMAGFWMDAAYVAERVLTLDELKAYVDRFWPTVDASQVQEESERYSESDVSPKTLRERIRYLLARRLTRQLRGNEARAYYPIQWIPQFEALAAALQQGWDENQPNEHRATALFQAALITRTNGMELIGTEVAPDWHYHDGNFEEGVTAADRRQQRDTQKIRPSADELERYSRHAADPDVRFHYRYQAASLAWEAAKLLPDNNDQTAYILWQGGCFLKARDPQTADLFYKALVRRNRKTVLGAEADRQRWFPSIDENGQVVPRRPRPAKPAEDSVQEETAEPPSASAMEDADNEFSTPKLAEDGQEYTYVIHKGDSLAFVARKFSEVGVPVTVADILAANPQLDPARLRVGTVVFVPAPE